MASIKRNQIANGATFTSVKDDRFKTMKISANIILPLNEKTASSNAVLCGTLVRSCREYPDFTVLSRKLSALYGAELTSSVRKCGDMQMLSISASGLDDRYTLNNDSVSQELSKLLCSVIFEPNLEGEKFVKSEVEQEKRQMLDLIDSEFNDKRIYANSQLVSNMCADEVYGIKRYGTADNIRAIDENSLYETWKNMLENAVFEILYIGDSPSDGVAEVFKSAFDGLKRTPCSISTQVVKSAKDVKRVNEEMELSQSKLVMGFRTEYAVPDKQVKAAQLMCAILGGTANSKLFCNVREKQSLCYYCAARYNKAKGIMTVDSGVEGDNIEKAEQGILKEIEDMKNGNITDFEISATKMAVINSFYTSNDSVSGIESWYLNQLFDNGFETIEEASEKINAVTKEEIVDAAQKLTLDTIYVLKNK